MKKILIIILITYLPSCQNINPPAVKVSYTGPYTGLKYKYNFLNKKIDITGGKGTNLRGIEIEGAK